jgi:short subunit dehydrogenase-like uncharacterized protein
VKTSTRPYDLIVFGATGFTGRLVAQYLVQAYGSGGVYAHEAPTWALAGRSLRKLEQVRDLIGAPADLPLITVDAQDAKALRDMAALAKVIITTVGPYQLHGEPLLKACVEAGTDYVDLCGEPNWMADMIGRHHSAAQASGARIVFSCGFDSIPFDMGVLYLQTQARQRFGAPLRHVAGRVKVMKGGVSGGTAASLLATMNAAGGSAAVAATMRNPFALTPGFNGPTQPDDTVAVFDEAVNSWAGPFVMAAINTKNVHRTNALRGHAYGRDFTYDERQLTGPGRSGELRARGLARVTQMQNRLLGFGPTRKLIGRFALPQPGQGPSLHERETGSYEVWFSGQADGGEGLRAIVKGDRDPGYGSTCKLIAESALCLIREVHHSATPGGIWTPAAAMGTALIERLNARAGLTFEMANEPSSTQTRG